MSEANKLSSNPGHNLEKFKALSEASSEALFFSDNGYCIECNDYALNMFGYTYNEVLSLFATDIIASESQELVSLNLKNKYPHPYTAKAIKKDGSVFWVEIHGRMVEYLGKTVRLSAIRDISVQKEAEEAMAEIDLKYRLLFESISDAFAIHKIIFNSNNQIADLIYMDANPAFITLSNREKEDLIGNSIRDIWKNMKDSVWEQYNTLLNGKKTIKYDYYHNLDNRYYEIKAHIPQKGYLAQTITDVTDKKRALFEMERNNERLKLLVYFSEIATESLIQLIETVLEKSARFINSTFSLCFVPTVNNDNHELISYSNEVEPNNINWNSWYNSLTKEEKLAAKIMTIDQQNAVRTILSIPIYRNNAVKFHFIIGGINKGNYNKEDLFQLSLLFESCYSILERQKYEEQIFAEKEKAKISEYRFAEIQKAGKIGWYEALIKENTFIGSHEAHHIFFDNYKGPSIKPEDLSNAIHPDDRAYFFDTVKENVIKKNKVFDWEYRVVNPKKGLKYVFSRAYLEFNDEGELIRRFGIVQDITEKKKDDHQLILAKEKAIESDRLKSAFLANMSHEIRTPMNGIIGFSELLLLQDITEDKKKEYAKIVIESGKHLLNIVDDILDISKIEVGQLNIIFEPVTVNDLIEELYAFYLPKAEESDILFNAKVELESTNSKICTDKYRLIQILNNLLSNAFKFTRKGKIQFGYVTKDEDVEFFVKDSGIGIPEEFHTAVFDRFRQTDQDIVREVGGTGLGLAITEKLVNLLGGKIWLESVEGKGTSFYFTLPYQKSLLKRPEPVTTNQNTAGRTATLLIAEDEEMNFLFLKELLESENFDIIRAENGLEAIEICKLNPHIDLVLMDIKMPKMDGLEATSAIKEFRPTLPIIMQTAYAIDSDKRKAFDSGCTGFLPKPIIKDNLLEIINSSLGKKNTKFL